MVQLFGLGLEFLPLCQVDSALAEQVIGHPHQLGEMDVGRLLPVGRVVELALPVGQRGKCEVITHDGLLRGIHKV